MRPHNTLTALIVLAILCSHCGRYSYYMSPLHTTDHPYRAHLLNADSGNKATFISGSIAAGGYNDDLVDGAWLVHTSIYNTHKLGNTFRAWYGANLGFGQYDVSNYDGYNVYGNSDPLFINANDGTKTMGGIGAFGGLMVVGKLDEKAEWRVLSFETSYLKEFGGYLNFRNKMSDTLVDAYYPHNYLLSSEFGTEFAFKTKKGAFGFKYGYLVDWNRMTGYFEDGRVNPRIHASLFTMHFSRGPNNYFTSFATGRYALTFRFGMNVRIH